MKNIIIGFGTCVVIILIIIILYTQSGKSNRQTELENGLSSAMETAIMMLSEDRAYAPRSNEEFITDFVQAFLLEVDSYSDVTVHILDADYKKGLLRVEAVMDYQYPNGRKSTVSAERTIILEQYDTAEHIPSYTIRFIVDGATYEAFTLQEGTELPKVYNPEKTGETFVGWEDVDSGEYLDVEGMTAQKDMTLVAVFER